MKPIKVFFHGKRLKDIYPHATRWQVFKYKTARLIRNVAIGTAIVAFLSGISYGSYKAGAELNPRIVSAQVRVEVPVTNFPPILQKICNAEVTGNPSTPSYQFNKDGSVVRGKVNRSDIGYCMINEPLWNDQARKLGYDIYTEQGNKDMALWLFQNYGNEPWYLSKSMWKK